MQQRSKREPIFAPYGLRRLAVIIGVILLGYAIHGVLRSILAGFFALFGWDMPIGS